MAEHAPILIVVIPLLSAFLCPLIGLWKKEACYALVVISISLCALASLYTLSSVMESGNVHYRLGSWAPPWGIELVIDHFGGFVVAIISLMSLFAAVYGKDRVEKELAGRTVYFYTVFLLLVTGLLGIVITGDVFNLYVFLEVSSLSAYALIAIGKGRAPVASFRYIVMGTIGACFYLYSTILAIGTCRFGCNIDKY